MLGVSLEEPPRNPVGFVREPQNLINFSCIFNPTFSEAHILRLHASADRRDVQAEAGRVEYTSPITREGKYARNATDPRRSGREGIGGFRWQAARTPDAGRVCRCSGPVLAWIHGLPAWGSPRCCRSFRLRAAATGSTVIRLDCRFIEPTPEGFLFELQRVLKRPARPSRRRTTRCRPYLDRCWCWIATKSSACWTAGCGRYSFPR